jgi:hypothetical protein
MSLKSRSWLIMIQVVKFKDLLSLWNSLSFRFFDVSIKRLKWKKLSFYCDYLLSAVTFNNHFLFNRIPSLYKYKACFSLSSMQQSSDGKKVQRILYNNIEMKIDNKHDWSTVKAIFLFT